jgi:hypothetical protein
MNDERAPFARIARTSCLAAVTTMFAACSSSGAQPMSPTGGTGGTSGASGTSGTGGASGNGGTSGAGGTDGGGTSGTGDADAGATRPGSDAAPPQYGDGGAVPVGTTPPAQWVNVTGNLAGMPSECGNTQYLTSHPSHDMLITVVAQHGVWASTDGAASWHQLWANAGNMQITNRGSSVVFDPAAPDTWWESGIYNGAGVYRTTDDGATFTALGTIHYIDSVSVDLNDPKRLTLLAGGHEMKQAVYRSADGGGSWTNVGLNLPAAANFCTNTLVIDQNTHLVGCSGYAGGMDGVFRTVDGGKTWASSTNLPAASLPLWASDGTIYWSLIYDRGLIKSTDQGRTWTQPIQGGKLKTVHPIELPDGRIVAAGAKTLMISSDKGATFTPLGDSMPITPNSISYSPFRNAFYIEYFTCQNPVPANAIARFGFDYRAK